MKKVLLFIFILVLTVASAAGVLWFMKDGYIESKIQKDFQSLIGTPVTFSEMKIDKETKVISIDQIKIHNFEGFNQTFLAVITNVKMECNLTQIILSGEYYCTKVSAAITDFNFEKTLDGKFNMKEVQALSRANLEEEVSLYGRQISGFMIERLELQIQRAILFENVAGQPVRKTESKLHGRTEIFGYLSDPDALIFIPTIKALAGMKRGSLGLPRSKIQTKLMKVTGKF